MNNTSYYIQHPIYVRVPELSGPPSKSIKEKDKSHHRVHLLIGLRLVDYNIHHDEDDFVKTIYLPHLLSIKSNAIYDT